MLCSCKVPRVGCYFKDTTYSLVLIPNSPRSHKCPAQSSYWEKNVSYIHEGITHCFQIRVIAHVYSQTAFTN